MFVAMTASGWNKLRRSGMNEGSGLSDPDRASTDHEDMSLRGSFPNRVAREAINMTLLRSFSTASSAWKTRVKRKAF
jgi:hypothetical protein